MTSVQAGHGNSQAHHDVSVAVATDQVNGSSLAAACAELHRRVYAFLSLSPASEKLAQAQRQTVVSLGVIAEALERYRIEELSFSYNGGKDCLVLLILYLTALHTYATEPSTPTLPGNSLPPRLASVYIVPPNPFPAVTRFVETSAARYALDLARYDIQSGNMRNAFASYLADQPRVRAIFVGTRRTDPHGATLTHFDPTNQGWPSFMRVHPVIDWHYADIWEFIRGVGVPYCELYDQGYTSLGGTEDTLPNPALALAAGAAAAGTEDAGEQRYRPAYELTEDDEERLGRDR